MVASSGARIALPAIWARHQPTSRTGTVGASATTSWEMTKKTRPIDHPGAPAAEAGGGQVAEPTEDRIRHQGEEGGDREDRGVGHGGRAGVAVEQGLGLQRQAHRDRGQQGDEQTELGDGHGDHDPGRRPVGRHGPVAADGGIEGMELMTHDVLTAVGRYSADRMVGRVKVRTSRGSVSSRS